MNCKNNHDEFININNEEQERVNKNFKNIAYYFLTMMLILLSTIAFMVNVFDNNSEQLNNHEQINLNDIKQQESEYDDKSDIQAANNQGFYKSQDLYASESCDNGDVISELGSNDLINNDEGVTQLENALEKRARSWKTSFVDGTVSMFSFIVNSADAFYATACTPTFLGALGVANPAGAGATLAACGWSGAVLAVMNWTSYVVSSHNDNGGWNWDSDSARDKRSFDILSETFGYLPDSAVRPLVNNLYSIRDDKHEYFQLLTKRDSIASQILDHGLLYDTSLGKAEYIGYQFIADHGNHNKSVVIQSGSENDAIETWHRCGDENECFSDNIEWVDQNEKGSGKNRLMSMTKRTGNLYWQSYNDWGENGGYVHDWWYWDEFSKAAQEKLGDQSILQKVQSCTNDFRCYGVHSKICLAGGMSNTRTKDSAWVGEVYANGYGGIDGECQNG